MKIQIDLDALPTAEERKKISREVEMLKQLNHKHILRIRDHWENPKTNQLCFITDILQGGSLRELSIEYLSYIHCNSLSPRIFEMRMPCDWVCVY